MSAKSVNEAINSADCNHSIFSNNSTAQKPYYAVGGGGSSTGAHYGLIASYYCSFVIAAIAIIMSSTMLFVIARLLRKRNAFLLLAANLCVADVCVACFTITQHTFSYLQHRPSELVMRVKGQSTQLDVGEWLCAESVAAQLWDVSTNVNLFTILLMTLSHLVSLKWPHHSKKLVSRSGVLIAIIFSWLAAGSMGFTRFIVVMTTDISHEAAVQNSSFFTSYCIRMWHYNELTQLREKHMEILFSASVATILLVYISMLVIYIYIFRRVWARMLLHKNRGKHEGFLTRVRLMRRTLVTTLFLLGSFSILWLPIVIYSALRSMDVLTMPNTLGKENFESLRVALATLVCVSGIVDPLLYGMRMLDIRNVIKSRLKPLTVSSFSCVPTGAGRSRQMHAIA